MAVRTYSQLLQTLNTRADALKQASTKSAAGDTPTEKDLREKGTVEVPKDPQAQPSAELLPERPTNTEVTPVLSVAPAKVVDGPEKPANALLAQAKKVAGAINSLRNTKVAARDTGKISPGLVSDTASENKNTTAPIPGSTSDKGPAKKQNPDPVTKAAGIPEVTDATNKGTELPKGDSKGALPKPVENENTTKVNEQKAPAAEGAKGAEKEAACASGCTCPKCTAKMAAALEFTPEFHYKLASLILATDEGQRFAQQIIEQAHGAAEAEDIIKAAAFMEEESARLQELEAQGAFAAEEMWKAASEEERVAIIKLANIHALAKAGLKTDFEKQAYDDGAAAGAGMADAGVLGGAAAGGAPGAPGEAGAVPPPPGAEAGAAGADSISDEDIVAVLEELVQSGKIKPEEAQAILEALQQGGGGEAGADAGAAGPAGAGPAGADAGGPPPDDSNKSPEDKEASAVVKSASSVVDSIIAAMAKTDAKK
jgi:hypothetical protein